MQLSSAQRTERRARASDGPVRKMHGVFAQVCAAMKSLQERQTLYLCSDAYTLTALGLDDMVDKSARPHRRKFASQPSKGNEQNVLKALVSPQISREDQGSDCEEVAKGMAKHSDCWSTSSPALRGSGEYD